MTIICSLAGCGDQQYHLDFKEKNTRSNDGKLIEIPYLMLVPLESNTTLGVVDDMYQSKRQKLNPGNICVGRYDLLHCGSGYKKMKVCRRDSS